jgi:hypothetical protein
MKGVIMMKRSFAAVLLTAVASATILPDAVVAQAGGNFTITRSVITGGGGRSASGNFIVDGTIGQSVAGVSSTGDGFDLATGFWGGIPVSTSTPTATPTASPTPVICPDVSTPVLSSRTSPSGLAVIVPVNTSDLTGLGVMSADITFNYDASVISPSAADISVTAGSVSQGAQVMYDASTAGTILISVFGPPAFAGAGTVVELHLKVIGPIGSTTPLSLTDFRYNGGLICSNATSGTLTVVSGTVMGRVTFENEPFPAPTGSPTPVPIPVPGTRIDAVGGTNFFSIADANGNYSLAGFGPGAYTITPSRPDESSLVPNGIFSNDATLVSRHVVGLITLNATQMRAADVSGFHSISSLDASLIAQWIVGIRAPLNRTGQWIFTPPSTTPDTNIDSTQDYRGLLMGDVSGDWTPTAARPGSSLSPDGSNAVRVSIPDVKARLDSPIMVPLRIEGLRDRMVGSYQFGIEYDPTVIEPIDPAVDLSGTVSEGFGFAANAPEAGTVKVVVYGPIPVFNDGVYVYLRFRTVGKVWSVTPLTITDFRMNEGQEKIDIVSGRLIIR